MHDIGDESDGRKFTQSNLSQVKDKELSRQQTILTVFVTDNLIKPINLMEVKSMQHAKNTFSLHYKRMSNVRSQSHSMKIT